MALNDAALDGAIGAIGTVAIGSLLLPGIDQLWDAHPRDGVKRKQLRSGEQVYFLILATAGVLQSLRAKSIFPLVFVLALGAVVAFTFERAIRSPPDDPDA